MSPEQSFKAWYLCRGGSIGHFMFRSAVVGLGVLCWPGPGQVPVHTLPWLSPAAESSEHKEWGCGHRGAPWGPHRGFGVCGSSQFGVWCCCSCLELCWGSNAQREVETIKFRLQFVTSPMLFRLIASSELKFESKFQWSLLFAALVCVFYPFFLLCSLNRQKNTLEAPAELCIAPWSSCIRYKSVFCLGLITSCKSVLCIVALPPRFLWGGALPLAVKLAVLSWRVHCSWKSTKCGAANMKLEQQFGLLSHGK